VMVAPEFDLPNYKGLEITAPKLDVTDEQVTNFIDDMRRRDASYPEITDRGAAEGDVIIIDYHGFIDGRPLREVEANAPDQLYHAHEFPLLVKEPHFMEGFCTQLLGLKTGDNKQIKVTVPKELPFEALAGKEVSYDVEVKNLHEVVLPELNEEYLKKAGVESVEKMQEVARNVVTRDEQQKIEAHKAQQIVDQLNQAVGFELPTQLVSQATWQRAQQLIRTNLDRGLGQDQIDNSGEEIMNAAKEQAQFDVKTRFILSRIAEQEKIQVGNQEVAQELMNIAYQRRLNTKADINKLMKDEGLRQQVIENILTAKTIGFIIKESKITEVDAVSEAKTEA
jgi:trigger factor